MALQNASEALKSDRELVLAAVARKAWRDSDVATVWRLCTGKVRVFEPAAEGCPSDRGAAEQHRDRASQRAMVQRGYPVRGGRAPASAPSSATAARLTTHATASSRSSAANCIDGAPQRLHVEKL